MIEDRCSLSTYEKQLKEMDSTKETPPGGGDNSHSDDMSSPCSQSPPLKLHHSPTGGNSDDSANISGRSRKKTLLNQYRKEQYLQNEKSDKEQVQRHQGDKIEEGVNSDSSSTDRFIIDTVSSPESEHNGIITDETQQLNDNSNLNDNTTSTAHLSLNEDYENGTQYTENNNEGTQAEISPSTSGQNMAKNKKPNPLISDTKKCQVCMAPAAKHVHYGATTCFSCRAFFRRSIQTSQSRNYVCRRQGDCAILPDTRKGCQKCRLEACLRIGMKPGWVLNEDERARRFRKLRMKKAERSGANSTTELSNNGIQDTAVNESEPNMNVRLSPSPTAYARRRRPNFRQQESLEEGSDNINNGGYKRMYLQLRDGQEVIDSTIDKDGTASLSSVYDSGASRDANSSKTQPEMHARIKLECDEEGPIAREDLSFTLSERMVEETRRFPRVEEAYSLSSRQPQFRDEIVEKSIAFLRNKPVELAAMNKDPDARIFLGQSRSEQSYSSESNVSMDRFNKGFRSKFNTIQSITPPPMTSTGFRSHTSPDYTHGQGSPISKDEFEFSSKVRSPPPSSVVYSQQRNINASEKLHSSTRLQEPWCNSFDNKSSLPESYVRDYESIIQMKDYMEWKDSRATSILEVEEESQGSSHSAHPPRRRASGLTKVHEPLISHVDSIQTHCVGIATRLEGMLAGPGEDEINVINEFVSEHDMHYKSINFGEDLIKEMIMSSIFGIPMSANTAMSAYRLMVQRVTRVSKHYNDFQNLSVKVQGILLKHNADLVVSLRGASFFQMKTGLDQILTSLGLQDLESAKNMILTTLKSNSTKEEDYKKIEYKKWTSGFNTVQKTPDQTASEKRYDILLSRIGKAVAFNQNLIKMLSYILIFCSDFHDEDIDLDEKTNVGKAQEKLIIMVQRYIFATYPDEMAGVVFAGLMECLGNLRELVFIKNKRKKAQTPTTDSNVPSEMVH